MIYNKLNLDLPVKIPINNTEYLKKILLILDTYDIYWLGGERPFQYITEINYPTCLVITKKYKLCIRSIFDAKIMSLKEVLEL